jgi:hypothetical protein
VELRPASGPPLSVDPVFNHKEPARQDIRRDGEPRAKKTVSAASANVERSGRNSGLRRHVSVAKHDVAGTWRCRRDIEGRDAGRLIETRDTLPPYAIATPDDLAANAVNLRANFIAMIPQRGEQPPGCVGR